MNTTRASAFALAVIASTSGLAAKPPTASQSMSPAPVLAAPMSAKKSLLSVQLLAGSNSLNMKISGSAVSQESNSKLSGTSPLSGIAVGFTRKLADQLGIEANLGFISKKFDAIETNGISDNVKGEESLKMSALRLSAVARIYLAPQLSLGIGPYASHFVGNYTDTSADGTQKSEPFSDGFYKRSEFGATVSARGEIPISSEMAFVVDARYFHGLTNVLNSAKLNQYFPEDQIKMTAYTRDFQLGAGVGFVF